MGFEVWNLKDSRFHSKNNYRVYDLNYSWANMTVIDTDQNKMVVIEQIMMK